MKDDRFTELVSRMLDDDLSDIERAEVERRMREDPAARREAAELRLTVSLLRELAEEPAPATLLPGLRERLDRPSWVRRLADWLVGGPVLTPARGLAFALVLIVVGGVWLFSPALRAPRTGKGAPLAVAKNEIPAAVPATVPERAKEEASREALATATTERKRAERETARSLAPDGDDLRTEESLHQAAPLIQFAAVPSPESGSAAEASSRDRLAPSPVPPPVVAGATMPPSPEIPLPRMAAAVYEPGPDLAAARAFGGHGVGGFIGVDLETLEPVGETVYHFTADAPPAPTASLRATEADKAGGGRFTDEGEGMDAGKAPCRRLVRASLRPQPMGEKAAEPATREERTITFEKESIVREFKGVYSGLKARATYVVETEEEWRALWEKLTANLEPRPATPAIDFARNFAVGVSMGERPAGGYSTTIDEIELQGTRLVVKVHETRPGQGGGPGGLTLALTQPYHILFLPRQIGGETFSTDEGFTVDFEYK